MTCLPLCQATCNAPCSFLLKVACGVWGVGWGHLVITSHKASTAPSWNPPGSSHPAPLPLQEVPLSCRDSSNREESIPRALLQGIQSLPLSILLREKPSNKSLAVGCLWKCLLGLCHLRHCCFPLQSASDLIRFLFGDFIRSQWITSCWMDSWTPGVKLYRSWRPWQNQCLPTNEVQVFAMGIFIGEEGGAGCAWLHVIQIFVVRHPGAFKWNQGL